MSGNVLHHEISLIKKGVRLCCNHIDRTTIQLEDYIHLHVPSSSRNEIITRRNFAPLMTNKSKLSSRSGVVSMTQGDEERQSTKSLGYQRALVKYHEDENEQI